MGGLDLTQFSTQAALLTILTAFTLLVSQDWRWSLGALFVQYVGIFILVYVSWPLSMALIKLIAGWISGVVLGMAVYGVRNRWRNQPISDQVTDKRPNMPIASNVAGFFFHLLAAILVGLTILSVLPGIADQFPEIQINQLLSSLFLIGLGILHLGFTNHPLRAILGLLTVISGFEIVYAAVENSTLVAGLLSGVNLCLATLGAYLIINPTLEGGE